MPDTTTDSAQAAATSATDTTQQTDQSVAVTDTTQQAAQTTAQAADTAKAVETSWPTDWREKYAGDDDKKLKKLGRYASPQAALDALFNAQARISSGELKAPLKEDATPEEKAAWRAENNIPETPDKYELKLSDGLIVGDADKPLVDDFLKTAHDRNMDSATVSTAVDWFLNKQQQAVEQQAEADANRRQLAFEALREEFGPNYKTEIKIAEQALENAPADLKDAFLSGRLADGTLIGDSPSVIRWLNNMARELNPVGTVVPGSGANAAQAVETEMNSIKKMMGDSKSDYWRGPNSAKLQARYRELTTAMTKQR